MSITALVTGKLIAKPEQRTGASGKAFTTFRLVAGTDDESVFASGIAFGSLAEQVAALAKGDTLAIVGRTKPKTWTGKDGAMKVGLDMVVDQVLTAYHLRQRRSAMTCDSKAMGGGRSIKARERDCRADPCFEEDDGWLRRGAA